MKTDNTFRYTIIALILLFPLCLFGQQSKAVYAADGKSGNFSLLLSDCQTAGWGYEFEIDVPKNIPIIVSIKTSSYNYYEIYDQYNMPLNVNIDHPEQITKRVISYSGKIIIDAADVGMPVPTGQAVLEFEFYTDTMTPLAMNSVYTLGNLGVGTKTPENKLDIVDGLAHFSFSGNNTMSKSEVANVLTDDSYELKIKAPSYKISLYGHPILTSASNGNVGIGTSSPSQKLSIDNGRIAIKAPNATVSDEGYNGALMITKPAASGQYINLVRQGLYPWSIGTVYNSNTFGIGYGKSTDSQFTSPFFTIDPNGQVGIGTPTPSAKLDVAGNARISGTITTNEIHFFGTGNFGDDNSDPYTLRKVHDSGNVSHLDLNLNDDADESFRIYGYSCNGYNCSTYSGNLYHSFDASGNAYHAGKLGIGTTKPDEALTVKGKIHAEEVIVDLNVPVADYVFDTEYRLMPLHQVERFVKENRHLPEVPSATEIKEKGLSMGEMQNKLLQKIEELTLYVIEQQKQIEGLKKQLSK